MTRPVLLAAAAATIAVVLTACGGEGVSDAGPSGSSTVSTRVSTSTAAAKSTEPAAGSTEPAAETTKPAAETTKPAASAAPEPSTAPPTADPCAEVTREYLITTLRMTGSPRFPLADLQRARCSGTYASAQSMPDGALHPEMYLFKYSELNGWRVIDVGNALDCVNRHGVPADVGREIGCAA
ncbi:hypothetical protein [Nocardia sp. NPDC057440]|uniref:hypothetical protein n=1 Tax=Nocardia sp. NPDC057440 TaxID=3346134 RepID=UPI00366D28D1